MSERAILCENLWHIYPGDVVALREANLEIQQGEIVGIIGQNGSGKTTLVKHFNGLLKPSRGRVVVNGVDAATKSVGELSRHVGYVFQNPNHQLFAKTVEEELAFGPTNLGLSPREVAERVESAIAFFGLEPYRTVHPYRISFPLRKVVAMASIYAMRPKVFVLDEPTTGQDYVGTMTILNLVRRLKADGATVILVSHDMPLIAEMAERVVVLWNAQIIGDATPREIFSDDELMQRTNLHPPQITELSRRLQHPALPEIALSVEELVGPLAHLL
ncbi:MAG: energy-coupling factor ABC transporter ATP-binding protein [Anaerolineae bacterium]